MLSAKSHHIKVETLYLIDKPISSHNRQALCSLWDSHIHVNHTLWYKLFFFLVLMYLFPFIRALVLDDEPAIIDIIKYLNSPGFVGRSVPTWWHCRATYGSWSKVMEGINKILFHTSALIDSSNRFDSDSLNGSLFIFCAEKKQAYTVWTHSAEPEMESGTWVRCTTAPVLSCCFLFTAFLKAREFICGFFLVVGGALCETDVDAERGECNPVYFSVATIYRCPLNVSPADYQ